MSGRVVVEPCRADLDSRQVSLTCPIVKQTSHEQVSLSTLQRGQPSMMTAAKMDYHWVDPAHTMAIIAISYY